MDFVDFNLAKKLKEKWFREECSARYYCSDKVYFERNCYHPDTESVFYCYNNDEDLGRFYIDAPTISQVLKWLRDEKRLDAGAVWDNRDGKWVGYVNEMDMPDLLAGEYVLPDTYDSYEQAVMAGIGHVLDNNLI